MRFLFPLRKTKRQKFHNSVASRRGCSEIAPFLAIYYSAEASTDDNSRTILFLSELLFSNNKFIREGLTILQAKKHTVKSR